MKINKIRVDREGITTNEIQRIIREYFEKLYSNKLRNPRETNTVVDAYDVPQLNQENISFKKSVMNTNREAVIKIPILHKLFQK
jgi:hypothetical protein